MKKIVIVTAVLTTTLVYDASAKDSSKPESMDTVVDIVAVGQKDNTGAFELSNADARAIAELVQSDVMNKEETFANTTRAQKKEIKKNAKMVAAEKRATELAAANKSWFKPRGRAA